MITLENLEQSINTLHEEILDYHNKPTKARSKRIRMLLGQVKQSTPALRKALVNADKTGY